MSFDESKINRQGGRFANKATEPGQRASAPPPAAADDVDSAIDMINAGGRQAAEVGLQHQDPVVRAVFAGSALARQHADAIAADADPVVRSTLAQRWDLPLPAALERDVDPLVAVAVSARPDITDELRDELLARPDVARYAALIFV